jgi:hypothetical protein
VTTFLASTTTVLQTLLVPSCPSTLYQPSSTDLRLKCSKTIGIWGFALDPTGEAHDAHPGPVVGLMGGEWVKGEWE